MAVLAQLQLQASSWLHGCASLNAVAAASSGQSARRQRSLQPPPAFLTNPLLPALPCCCCCSMLRRCVPWGPWPAVRHRAVREPPASAASAAPPATLTGGARASAPAGLRFTMAPARRRRRGRTTGRRCSGGAGAVAPQGGGHAASTPRRAGIHGWAGLARHAHGPHPLQSLAGMVSRSNAALLVARWLGMAPCHAPAPILTPAARCPNPLCRFARTNFPRSD